MKKISLVFIFILLAGMVGGMVGFSKVQAVTRIFGTDNNGLIGWWSFDPGDRNGNTINDRSSSGYTMTKSATASFASGKIANSIYLSTTSTDYASTVAFTMEQTSTVSFWFNTASVSDSIAVLQQKSLGFEFYRNAGNTAGYIYYLLLYKNGAGGTGYLFIFGDAAYFQANTWYHVAITLGADGSYVGYINGQSAHSGTLAGNFQNWIYSSTNLYVGYAGGTTYGFKGYVDDLKIYNRKLTAAEVSKIYKIGRLQTGPTATSTIQASRNSVFNSGLVGVWSFDGKDISGTTAYDRGTGGRNGTIKFNAARTIGKVGQALYFDGVSDRVELANSYDYGASAGTISAWAQSDDTSFAAGEYQWIIGRNLTGTNDGDFGLYINQGTMQFQIENAAGGSYCDANAAFSDANWHFYAGTWGTAGTFLYVDGVKQTDTAAATTLLPKTDSTVGIAIGQGSTSSTRITSASSWEGKIDDVRLYDRQLSDGEVKQLYQMGRY